MALHSWIPSRPTRHLLSCALFAALLATVPSAHAQPAKTEYRPEARALFGGCKPQADGPQGRHYMCPGVSASIGWVSKPSSNPSTAQYLDLMRMGLATVVPGELSSQPTTLSLAGREFEALQLSVINPATKKVEHTGHLIMDRQEDGAWMFLCLGNAISPLNAKSCMKKLEFFAKHGAPEPVDLKTPPPSQKPHLFSRDLEVPEGCEVVASTASTGRIQCQRSGLTWYSVALVPAMEKWLKESADTYRRQVPGDLKESPARCNLEGVSAKCVWLEGAGAGPRLRMLVAVREHEKQGVQVGCMTFSETRELPPVCNGLLEVLPDAAADAGSAPGAGSVPAPAPSPDAGAKK